MGVEWYRDFSLFKELERDGSKSILSKAQRLNWPANTQVIGQFDEASEVFCLISGQCSAIVYSGDGVAVGFRALGPGSYFGELGVLTGKGRISSVIAETDVIAAKLSRSDFLTLVYNEPKIAQRLCVHLAEAVQKLTTRVVVNNTLNIRQRICSELLQMLLEAGLGFKSQMTLPMITHDKIASQVGANREAVTRELRRLKMIGAIDYDRRTLKITSSELLLKEIPSIHFQDRQELQSHP